MAMSSKAECAQEMFTYLFYKEGLIKKVSHVKNLNRIAKQKQVHFLQ